MYKQYLKPSPKKYKNNYVSIKRIARYVRRITFGTNSQMLTLYFVFVLSVAPPSIADLVMDNIQAVISIAIGILVIMFLLATVAYQSK